MKEKIIYAKDKCETQIIQNKGVTYLSFDIFAKYPLVQGFSTRLGGVSEGMWTSMNLSFTRGDDEEHVRTNFKRIGDAIGFEPENLVFTDQQHKAVIRKVTKEDKGKGYSKPRGYEAIDGLMTNEAGLVLTTFFADCVPVYIYDPIHHAVGCAHSGWRGTVSKISQELLHRMKEEYGTKAEEVVAAIGPSICQKCYEVSEEVILEFVVHYTKEQVQQFAYKKENGKYQLDLWKANQLALVEAGVKKERIQMPDFCTCCNHKWLFSHRASGGKRGNLAGFFMLKEK